MGVADLPVAIREIRVIFPLLVRSRKRSPALGAKMAEGARICPAPVAEPAPRAGPGFSRSEGEISNENTGAHGLPEPRNMPPFFEGYGLIEEGIQRNDVSLSGRLVMVGFGSVGQGVLPLIRRHIAVDPRRITIITAEDGGRDVARACGVTDFRAEPVTKANYRDVLTPLLQSGDFLLNLAVDVSSVSLIALCAECGALYLDSCIEPWAGHYTDARRDPAERTNYWLREQARALNRSTASARPTAVLTHGVNPGLVSHFVKQALRDVARREGEGDCEPASRDAWARLAMRLGIKAIHVAEHDFQVGAEPKRVGEFVNTWSVEAFVAEGSQPAELGWGTHERGLPTGARTHALGAAAIYLEQPGVDIRVRSWTPRGGSYHGYLITHGESVSLAEYLTVEEGGRAVYRPTVHYAYRPCNDAMLSIDEFRGRGYDLQPERRVLRDEIVQGVDELGVLLCGNRHGVYWYGSRLDIAEARRLAPYNNATTLQTAAGVLAGMVWAIENPARGVVDPEEMDSERVLAVARPYLGEMAGVWGDWTPLQGRERLFPERLDRDDPWQFGNVLVR